jgi:hypothetical protein
MRIAVVCSLAILGMIFQSAPAQAEPLSPKAVTVAISGKWAIVPREPATPLPCDTEYVTIWTKTEDGKLIYYSRWAEDAKVSRSEIKTVTFKSGETFSGIHIKYDGETRKDDEGNPVEWLLVMPDNDSFYWQRRDWPFGYRTDMRKRCSSNDLLG